MKCPGQDSRYWDANAIYDVKCPACGAEVEFFKDEAKGRCPKCGFRFRNPEIDLGCAQWCPHADQCIGTLESAGDGPGASVIDALVQHTKDLRGIDEGARQQGLRALVQAQSLLLEEPGTPRVVLAAALLRGLGEAAPAAQSLGEAGLDRVSIAQVESLLSTPDPGQDAERRIVEDALTLARYARAVLEDPTAPPPEDAFQTRAAPRLARDLKRKLAS